MIPAEYTYLPSAENAYHALLCRMLFKFETKGEYKKKRLTRICLREMRLIQILLVLILKLILVVYPKQQTVVYEVVLHQKI